MSENYIQHLPCGCKVTTPFLLKILNTKRTEIKYFEPIKQKGHKTARTSTGPPIKKPRTQEPIVISSDSD